MPAFDWDGSEEKAREQRIAERRERVQERIRQAQRQKDKANGVQRASLLHEQALPSTSAAQQAASSHGAVAKVLDEFAAAVQEVVHATEQRLQQYRAACDAEEAALREQVADEAERGRGEGRGIDAEWEGLRGMKQPLALHAAMEALTSRCRGVLSAKDAVVASIRALLHARDEQYIRLLRAQGEQTNTLTAVMHGQHARLKALTEAELEAVEAAYMQERGELLAVQKSEVEGLLARRGSLEREFMEQYLAACEQYERELEGMRAAGVREHAALRRRLEAEVAGLELHLDGLKASHGLNADKLGYNYAVLVAREQESKDGLLQQKRRITREWAALNRLRKRYAAADAQHAADNARLSDEFQHVARAFNHLQCQSRHRKAANRARFEQVRDMKEEELAELLEELLEADQIIGSCVAGLPLPAGDADPGTVMPQVSIASGSESSLELIGTALSASLAAEASSTQLSDVQEAEDPLLPEALPAQPPGLPGPGPAAPPSMQTTLQDELPAAAREESSRLDIDAGAAAELLASIEHGALSLLMTDGTQRLSTQKLRALLRQMPSAAASGQLTAAAVARCLGLQREGTVDALGVAFRGAAAGAADVDGPAQGSRAPVTDKFTAPESPVRTQCVELGLQHLVQHLLASQPASVPHSASAPRTARQPAIARPPATSKQYWQARADVLLPRALLRTWELLEQQANSQLATLQGRTSSANKVLELQAENEELRAQLAEIFSSPAHARLHLPPTLLLRQAGGAQQMAAGGRQPHQ